MSKDEKELSDDIYGISDVVRGTQRVVVIVGRSGTDRLPANVSTIDLLREWGKRMWTMPEVILAPLGERIFVYTREATCWQTPVAYHKLDFVGKAWGDAEIARQLIDHYDSTLPLSRLELVVLGLECLLGRVKGTTMFFQGDLSYALMGLLRQRPHIEPTDSAFQAFARLSLANDSDQLLERMICLLPVDLDSGNAESGSIGGQKMMANGQTDSLQTHDKRHYWAKMSDHWDAKLWDVEPVCQVAGIAANDTVILDGAYGATIHWDSFERIAITTRETPSRALTRWLVRATPIWFFMGVLVLSVSSNNPSGQGAGAILLILGLVLILLSPMLILHLYSGKVWNAQPWLFGFEGHMDVRQIERKIWGFPCGRLYWAPYSSSLSQHRLNAQWLEDECEGTEPLLGSASSGHGHGHGHDHLGPIRTPDGEVMRLFTIVDTYTM